MPVLAKSKDQALAARALDALCSHGASAYLDALWLAFGDQWIPVRDELARKGLTSTDPNTPAPTARTRAWLELRALED